MDNEFVPDLLHTAIESKNEDDISQLINSNDYKINDSIGKNSYIDFAIKSGNIKIIKILLDNGATISSDIIPPFIYVNKNIIELLLKYEIDLSTGDSRGATYLHLAVENQLTDIIKILTSKRDVDINAKTDTLNQTPAMFAFLTTNKEIIQHFLQLNIDVSIKDMYKETLLHYAVKQPNLEFIKTVISLGADVDVANKFGFTPLHTAVKNNNYEISKLLLEHGASSSSANVEENSPLHIAVHNRSLEIAKLLVEMGADVNICGDCKLTPLHAAVNKGDKDMVVFLVENHADVNSTGIRDETPLNIAVAFEHEDIAEYLISKGAIVNHGNKEDMLLHMAVFNKNRNLVKLLLKNKADVTVKYNDGRTALHIAVEHNCTYIADLLLRAGADVNEKMNTGDTALHIAANNKDHETSQLLLQYCANINLKNNSDKTPLYIAAEKGFLNLVIDLLNVGPDMNVNKTVLHYAVKGSEFYHKKIIVILLGHGFSLSFLQTYEYEKLYDFTESAISNGHSGIVEYLLKFFIDANMPFPSFNEIKNPKTLLHTAVVYNHLGIAELLIKHGCQMNVLDNFDCLPIHYAVKNSNYEMVKLLLENNTIIKDDYQLLFMAVCRGNHKIIQEIMKHYKSVDIEDEFGTTALHFAAWNGDEETIQLLFDKGIQCKALKDLLQIQLNSKIEANIKDYFGEDVLEDFRKNIVTTPLHIAARKNYSDIVEALLEYGFDVDYKDGCGRTALHIASLYNNTGVMDVLIEFGADVCAIDEFGYSCIDYVNNIEMFKSNLLLDKVFVFIHGIDNVFDENIERFSTAGSDLLIKYLARLEFKRGKVLHDLTSRNNKDLYNKAVEEMKKLKKEIILKDISLYDVLISSINTLALYFRNIEFVQLCESKIKTGGFKVYKVILLKRMIRGKERRALLDEAEIFFSNILHLPDIVNSNIMSYLNNRDLRYVKQTYELVLSSSTALCKKS